MKRSDLPLIIIMIILALSLVFVSFQFAIIMLLLGIIIWFIFTYLKTRRLDKEWKKNLPPKS